MIDRHSIISLSKDQISSDLAGEAAILSLSDGVYYGLDEVGATVWNLLKEPCTLRGLCEGVLARYEVDAERCERDILALLEELHSRGLIHVDESSAAS